MGFPFKPNGSNKPNGNERLNRSRGCEKEFERELDPFERACEKEFDPFEKD